MPALVYIILFSAGIASSCTTDNVNLVADLLGSNVNAKLARQVNSTVVALCHVHIFVIFHIKHNNMNLLTPDSYAGAMKSTQTQHDTLLHRVIMLYPNDFRHRETS